jgi:hypothetical protein
MNYAFEMGSGATIYISLFHTHTHTHTDRKVIS